MEKMKIRKNFYELTEEDLQEMWENDMQEVKEGKYKTTGEMHEYWKERYGIGF